LRFLVAVLALPPDHVGALGALVLSGAACGATLVALPPACRVVAHSTVAALGSAPAWGVRSDPDGSGVARLLGPHLTGLLAAFPVIIPMLGSGHSRLAGNEGAVHLLHGMTIGFFAYALFRFTMSITIAGWALLRRLGSRPPGARSAGNCDRAEPPAGASAFRGSRLITRRRA
jgi:hypothetical protein